MKHFRRILFNTLTALSLLLAIATAGLWVRSYFARDQVTWRIDQIDSRNGSLWTYAEVECQSVQGSFYVRYYDQHGQPGDRNFYFRERLAQCESHHTFQWEQTEPLKPFGISQFGSRLPLPHWLLTAMFCVVPWSRFCVRWWRQRLAKPGRCPACGYDTRANPEKCSECGHEIPAKA